MSLLHRLLITALLTLLFTTRCGVKGPPLPPEEEPLEQQKEEDTQEQAKK